MILLYHGIVADEAPPERSCAAQALPAAAFVRHLEWIRRRRRIVPMAEYLESRRRRRIAALTFDDGLARTFENAEPYLRAEGIPATFFVSTAHVETRDLLWFPALDALCFEGEYASVDAGGDVLPLGTLEEKRRARRRLGTLARESGDPAAFSAALLARHPLSERALAEYRGMPPEAVRGAAAGSLFEIGSHTRTHPYLPLQSLPAQRREIAGSRAELERISGTPVRYFAYPGGDYDRTALALVAEGGYEAAFATVSRRLGDERLEIERIGIYSAPLWKVALKEAGIVPVARRLGVQIG
ncbi:MAG TPA: polysaccharide deacetylase family protein [Thermoanaerobaculia bacterium]|nr:polysaccharide deacetylase family protein [Thermoanaerobaculia bacterium]